MTSELELDIIRTKDTSGVIHSYVPSRVLGQGGFGTVFLAHSEDETPEQLVAVKKITYRVPSTEAQAELSSSLQNKWKYLDRLHHPNILKYLSAEVLVPTGVVPRVKGIVVMEYCSGASLSDFMGERPLSWAEIHDATNQILQGLVFLHDQRIVHGDMKTCNVMINEDQNRPCHRTYKIVDLDDYVRLSNATTHLLLDQRKNLRSTLQFMSPELMNDVASDKKISKKTDIWSLGCIVVDMIRLGKPFRFIQTAGERTLPSDILCFAPDVPAHALTAFVLRGGIPEIPYDTPLDVAKFLRKCFERYYKDRRSARELLVHSWITSGHSIEGFPVNVEDIPSSGQSGHQTNPGRSK